MDLEITLLVQNLQLCIVGRSQMSGSCLVVELARVRSITKGAFQSSLSGGGVFIF